MFKSTGNSSFCARNVLRVSVLSVALTLSGSMAAQADDWQTGNVITYTQGEWGTVAAPIVTANYSQVYASTFGVFSIGEPAPGFSARFTAPESLLNYLPANGLIGALNANLADPTTTPAGGYGGEVAALKLNVDFSAARVTLGSSGIAFGSLVFGNLEPEFNGLTVNQVLADANSILAGRSAGGLTLDEADSVAVQLNASFEGGAVSTFAKDYLFSPAASGGTISPAPEIDPRGFGVGLTMLLGGLAVLRGRGVMR